MILRKCYIWNDRTLIIECQKWRQKKKAKNEKDRKELKIQIIVMSIVQIQNWNFGLSKVCNDVFRLRD